MRLNQAELYIRENVLTAIFAITIIALLTVLALKSLGDTSRYLRACYYFGVSLWASWLPLVAILTYIALIGSNISEQSFVTRSELFDLSGFFGLAELVILFLVSPLFFTRTGNIMAAAITIYVLERMMLSSELPNANPALLILIGSSTSIAILCDKIPWLAGKSLNVSAHRFRETMILILAVLSMVVVMTAMIDLRSFTHWINYNFEMDLSYIISFFGLVLLFSAWLSIALGMTRHLVLPVVCLPSLFAMAFVTSWPSYVLVIPFSACLALSLAIADRRLISR